jgi:beta-glucosidase
VYNHKPTGRNDDYSDLTGQPMYPFGFGLSYTEFHYSNLTLDKSSIVAGESVVVRCKVRNTGKRYGDEVVQLYIRDEFASTVQPVKQLKGFRRISLRPNEEKEVTFTITPELLKILNDKMRWVVEPGDFRIMIGGSSRDIKLRGILGVRQGTLKP